MSDDAWAIWADRPPMTPDEASEYLGLVALFWLVSAEAKFQTATHWPDRREYVEVFEAVL